MLPQFAAAEGPSLAFGSAGIASDIPIEITAETLAVNEANGTVIFSGEVLIKQGEVQLSASRVQVAYAAETSSVAMISASETVRLVSGVDVAKADQADYDVKAGTVMMTGNVVLMQGTFALSSSQMTIDLKDGTAQMIGRVKTVLQPQSKP